MQKIVALSGGKDSSALALALQEYEPDNYIFIINPTGNELPEMQRHIEVLRNKLDGPLYTIGCGLTFEQLIYEQQMIPTFWARFCTRILKIEPTQQFLRQFEDPILHIGLRADEQSRGGADYGIECRFPFREWNWGLSEVWDYLNERGIAIPERTDCALCFFQRISEWWRLWRYYPEYWKLGERIERDIGYTFRKPDKDSFPQSLKDLRKSFEQGHVPRKINQQRKLTDMCMECRL